MSIQTIHDYSAKVRSTSTQNHSSHAFQHEAQWPNQTHAEFPWISCLHMLPNHAVASINCRWAWPFAAFAALCAAPVLLRRWPCLSCDMLRLAFSVFAAAPLTCLTTQSQTFSTTEYHTRLPQFEMRGSEEVVQGRIAVEWVFASSMNFAAGFLQKAGFVTTLGHWEVCDHMWSPRSDTHNLQWITCPGWSKHGKCRTPPAPCCRPTHSRLPGRL